jgi:hypothetical protein
MKGKRQLPLFLRWTMQQHDTTATDDMFYFLYLPLLTQRTDNYVWQMHVDQASIIDIITRKFVFCYYI